MKRNKTREERRLATKFKMAWIAGAIMWVFILLLLLGSIPKRSATSGANTDSARDPNHRQHTTLEENVNA
jgi:hypothetical protein